MISTIVLIAFIIIAVAFVAVMGFLLGWMLRKAYKTGSRLHEKIMQ